MAAINMTVKQQLAEYFKCKTDPSYFVEKYVILEIPGKNVNLMMYKPQKKFLMSLLHDHHCVALKSRQIGISTITQAFITYIFTFYKNVVVGVVSRSGAESTDFCRKTMAIIRNLPDWIRPKFTKEAEQTFILDNGCKFYAAQVNAGKPEGLLRGKSITVAVIDEASHIGKIDEAFSGLGPALLKSQKVAHQNNVPYGTIVISTPNKTTGIGKWYWQQWKNAQEVDTLFTPHRIHWKDIKEFREDPTWYKQQCEILGNIQWKIDQELEMKFLSSQDSYFPSDTIEALNNCIKDPISILNVNKHKLMQYEIPNMDKFYLIGIDTASAAGEDYSAIQVIDYETFNQVAEFREKLRVDDFCKVIELVNRVYRTNMMVVEANSYGNQVVEYLTRTGVSYNMYTQKLKNIQNSRKTKYRYGLWTGPQTRPLMFDALYTFIQENPEIVRSPRTSLDLIGLITKPNGRVEAEEGEHDDLALALAFCAYVKMYDPPLGMNSTFMQKNLVSDIMDTVGMNFEREVINPEIFDLPTEKEEGSLNEIEKTNKLIHNHIKKNLHTLLQNGTTIDITKILGFNTASKERNNKYNIPTPIDQRQIKK